jgi:hypothetical protein
MTITQTIVEEIDAAVAALSLSGKVRKLPVNAAASVVAQALDNFVSGNPRSWWISLKVPYQTHSLPDEGGYLHLEDFVPEGDKFCWFIPETEESIPVVYEAEVTAIMDVLSECSLFEYYLVGRLFSWLVIENDHNQLIVAKATSPKGENPQ